MKREFDPDNIIHSTEVLTVHGQLSKVEKPLYTQIFLKPSHPDGGNVSVPVTTGGVGNVGIDSPDIRNVFRIQFPPLVLDFLQDIGQAGRVHPPVPETYSCVIYYSNEGNFIIEHFVYVDVGSCTNYHHVYINIKIRNII